MHEQKHSRSYHRYFENYAEKQVETAGGGYSIERVYVGKYYKVDLSDQALRRQRILIFLLWLLGLGGYFAGALLSKVSAVSVVAIATMPPLLVSIWLTIAVFHRLFAPREMEIRSYRDSSESLILSAKVMTACILLCFAVTLGGCLLVPGYSLPATLPPLLCYLTCLCATCMLRHIEKATHYKIMEPKHERPAESSPIRYEMPE